MRVFDLALKDLLQLVRDWKGATFLVIMPVIFTIMLGFAFGGFGGGTQDSRLPVGFLDRDSGRVLSSDLLELLNASDAVRPVVLKEADAADLDKKVQDEDLAAVLIVPAGYSERMLAGETVQVEVIAKADTNAGITAQTEAQGAVARLVGAVHAAQVSVQTYAAQGSFPDEAARQEYVQEALDQAIQAWQDPPLTVAVTQSGANADKSQPAATNGFTHTSPAMMIQFAMAGLTGAAEVIVLERKSRTMQRLLTTAISRVEIIVGHFLTMILMILVQFVLLIGFAQLALRVNYLREPLAVLLMMVTTALWVASMGLLIGVLAKTLDQVIIFALVPMFILSGLGGAWMPLEYTNSTFQAIGHLMPTAWAMDGFKNIIARGLGFGSVLLPAGILLAYAAVFFALAVWRFRFE